MSDIDLAEAPHLTTLPLELLHLIIQNLSPADLFRLCSTTHIFQDDSNICHDPVFWRNVTKSTFRIPIHQALAGARDGRRWMQLYRKMRTQTRIYGWGRNDGGCFGNQSVLMHPQEGVVGMPRRTLMLEKTIAGPAELDRGDAGVVADLQCGGWSVTMLNATGKLYTRGSLEDSRKSRGAQEIPIRLSFPPGYQALPEDNPYTTIKQFSSGRSHILGLSDSGRIWSWHVKEHPAVHIKFLPIDLVECDRGHHKAGSVRQVVAGWGLSSAYVVGTGIVTWPPSNKAEVDGFADQSDVDTLLIFEPKTVPLSGFSSVARTADNKPMDEVETDSADMVGEVTNYIVLSEYVLFVTHLGKVFAWKIHWEHERQQDYSVQIFPATSTPGPASPENFAIDVQGSHINFAILKKNGEVLLGENLDRYWTDFPSHLSSQGEARFRKIPAMQHTGVISLAFGDWHFHALHSDGSISSYGHDPLHLGALGMGLGMGPPGDEIYVFRGLRPKAGSPDRELIQQAMTSGRRIIFEEEKRLWLRQLWSDSTPAATERKNMCLQHEYVKAEVSEWVEQKLKAWERTPTATRRPSQDDQADGDELPAYFALSITAAGWHSGALVLVDDDKARAIRSSLWVPRSSVLRETQPSSTDDDDDSIDRSGDGVDPAPSFLSRAVQKFSAAARSFLGTNVTGHWTWANEGFPRLRLRSGEIMPGDGLVVDWSGPRDWKDVEWVAE